MEIQAALHRPVASLRIRPRAFFSGVRIDDFLAIGEGHTSPLLSAVGLFVAIILYEEISQRQRDVPHGLRDGMTAKELADSRKISEPTAHPHLQPPPTARLRRSTAQNPHS